jgi:CubicO group peptidase (beta-lactamase class C family)
MQNTNVAAPRVRPASRLRHWLIAVLAMIVCSIGWAVLVLAGTLQGWWRTSLAPTGDARAFMTAAARDIDASARGNVVFRLVERGRAFDEHVTSIGAPVDADTLFQVASLSKWVTAWG